VCFRDKSSNINTYYKYDSINKKWVFDPQTGLVTLLNSKELKTIPMSRDTFILRVTSKKFKKLYNLVIEDGWTHIKEKYKYDILLYKAL